MSLYEEIELLKNIKNVGEECGIEDKNMIEFKYNSGEINIALLRETKADFATTEHNLKVAQRYIETASAQLLQTMGRNDYTAIL